MAPKAYFARDEKGRLVKRYFDSPKEAERWQADMSQIRKAARKGKPIPLALTTTLGQYSKLWLKRLIKRGRTISTADGYARALRLHVLRYLNDKPLKDLDQATFELLFDHIQEEHGLDNASRNRVRAILRKLFEDAVADKLVAANPIIHIEIKKENPTKAHSIWTAEQCQTYLDGARAWRWDWYVFVQLMLNTGGRKNELTAAQWRHYDEERGFILIEQIYEQASRQIVQRTKSDGQRKNLRKKYAGVTPALSQVLKEHRAKTEHNGQDNFIVSRDDGQMFAPRYANTLHQALLNRLKLPHCRLHDLRHTLATLLYKKTRDAKAVQEQLGHSAISTTMRYIHLDADDAAERMESFDVFTHAPDRKGTRK